MSESADVSRCSTIVALCDNHRFQEWIEVLRWAYADDQMVIYKDCIDSKVNNDNHGIEMGMRE